MPPIHHPDYLFITIRSGFLKENLHPEMTTPSWLIARFTCQTGFHIPIIQTITKAIDTERVRLLEIITPHLKQTAATYPVDEMIREVNAYHQACSFGTGLQIVMESVEKREAFDKMARVQSIDDQIRTLADERGRSIAPADADTRMQILRDERIRLATGVTID